MMGLRFFATMNDRLTISKLFLSFYHILDSLISCLVYKMSENEKWNGTMLISISQSTSWRPQIPSTPKMFTYCHSQVNAP